MAYVSQKSSDLGIEDFLRKVHKYNLVKKTFIIRNHYQKQMANLTSDRAFGLRSVEIVISIHSAGPGFARVQHSMVYLQVLKQSDCLQASLLPVSRRGVCQLKTVSLFRGLE